MQGTEALAASIRFELTRVQVPAIRTRVVAMLANVDATLAGTLARDLGIDLPKALPKALSKPTAPEVQVSPALSLFSQPGEGGVATRRVAILVAHGIDGDAARELHAGLLKQGAVPHYIGPRLGPVQTEKGDTLEVEGTFESMPAVLFDAVAVPGGKKAATLLGTLGQAAEFIKDQYRHAKPILALAEGAGFVGSAGAPEALPSGEKDPGMLMRRDASARKALPDFIKAISQHRHHAREVDPPLV